MNRKTSLYLVALLAVMTLLVLPPASATEHPYETDEATVEAAKETSRGYMAIGAGLAIGLALATAAGGGTIGTSPTPRTPKSPKFARSFRI